MVVYTPMPVPLTPYESLDRRLDTLSRQMDEMMVHFRTLATSGTPVKVTSTNQVTPMPVYAEIPVTNQVTPV
jgi:hypothetical protein